MIKAIKFTSIPVDDQDRALSFYTEKLGFLVATDQPYDDERRWIELRIPGAQTRLVLFKPEESQDPVGTTSHVAFETADVEVTYRELSKRGVEFVQEPESADWGTAAVFKDPDGNTFVLSSR